MVFQEKKPTPAIPLTEEEQTKLELEAQASEDRWVRLHRPPGRRCSEGEIMMPSAIFHLLY